MSGEAIYRDALMAHFRAPHHCGDLSGCERTARVYNPLCGDELEVGVSVTDGRIADARFRHRACSICVASASMMTEAVTGLAPDAVPELTQALHGWLEGEDEARPRELPEGLDPLAAVRPVLARHRCVTLPWEGLAEALEPTA